MREFFEKAYFIELERKTKLHTALAFPFSAIVIGFSLLGVFVEPENMKWYDVLLLIMCAGTFSVYLWSNMRFLIGREYKYLYTLDELVSHREELEAFSEEFPDAPPAEITLRKQFEEDLAKCTSHNSRINDARSLNLYYANASALIFVFLSLLFGIISRFEHL